MKTINQAFTVIMDASRSAALSAVADVQMNHGIKLSIKEQEQIELALIPLIQRLLWEVKWSNRIIEHELGPVKSNAIQ